MRTLVTLASSLVLTTVADVPAALAEDRVELDCLLEPLERVSLSTPTAGRIATLHVSRGDVVEPGQVLVELESGVAKANVELARLRTRATAELDSARLRLDFADAAYARSQELAGQSVISPQELDQSRSSRELAAAAVKRAEEDRASAELELARAEAVLAERRVASPLAALVVARHRAVGEFVDGEPILDLAQIDPLRVEVFAPARLWGRIRMGGAAQVRPEDPVGGEHPATVTFVDPVVDPRSGTFAVRLELPNPGQRLPAGLSCKVALPLERPEARHAGSPRPSIRAGSGAEKSRVE